MVKIYPINKTSKKRHWKNKLESHLTTDALWARVFLSGPRMCLLLLSGTPSLMARRTWEVTGLSEKDSINDFYLRPRGDVFWTEFSSPEGCANVNTIYFRMAEIKYFPRYVCTIWNKPHIVSYSSCAVPG